ncbi:hypothetical protein E4U43_000655 [Claviceps pusilla]|uniref:Uncharacterized protein n=1 Tax=Claviceps pusilla TaxID=123648 RepID=A0A9P7NBL8_9HYPO|nr:hypothetical protein E4U43_000655 [Claviceps pusilla]
MPSDFGIYKIEHSGNWNDPGHITLKIIPTRGNSDRQTGLGRREIWNGRNGGDLDAPNPDGIIRTRLLRCGADQPTFHLRAFAESAANFVLVLGKSGPAPFPVQRPMALIEFHPGQDRQGQQLDGHEEKASLFFPFLRRGRNLRTSAFFALGFSKGCRVTPLTRPRRARGSKGADRRRDKTGLHDDAVLGEGRTVAVAVARCRLVDLLRFADRMAWILESWPWGRGMAQTMLRRTLHSLVHDFVSSIKVIAPSAAADGPR